MPKHISNKNAEGETKLHQSGRSEEKKRQQDALAREGERKGTKARKRMRKLEKLRQREQMGLGEQSFGEPYENANENDDDQSMGQRCVSENNENSEDISGEQNESLMTDEDYEAIQLAEQRALEQWMAHEDSVTWATEAPAIEAPKLQFQIDEKLLAKYMLVEIMPGLYQTVEKCQLADSNEINNEMQGETDKNYETTTNDNNKIAIQSNELLTDNVGMSFEEEANTLSELPIEEDVPIVIEIQLNLEDLHNNNNVSEQEAETEAEPEVQVVEPPSVDRKEAAAIDFEAEIDTVMRQPSYKKLSGQKVNVSEQMAKSTTAGGFLSSYVCMLQNIEALLQKDYTELVQLGGRKLRAKRKYDDDEHKKAVPKKRKTKAIDKALQDYYRRMWLTAPMRNYNTDIYEMEAELEMLRSD